MNGDAPKQCPLKVADIEGHFRSLFENENLRKRADYEKCAPLPDLLSIDIKDVKKAIKTTSLDHRRGLTEF